MSDVYLEHFGIKGMKWGRRKSRPNPHEESKKSWDSKPVSQMSNNELRSRLNRLQMEKQYRELSPKQVDPGKKLAREILGNAGKQVATEVAKKALSYGVKLAFTSMAKNNPKLNFLTNLTPGGDKKKD